MKLWFEQMIWTVWNGGPNDQVLWKCLRSKSLEGKLQCSWGSMKQRAGKDPEVPGQQGQGRCLTSVAAQYQLLWGPGQPLLPLYLAPASPATECARIEAIAGEGAEWGMQSEPGASALICPEAALKLPSLLSGAHPLKLLLLSQGASTKSQQVNPQYLLRAFTHQLKTCPSNILKGSCIKRNY